MNVDTLATAIILALGALLCFRIAWEEYRWPKKPKYPQEPEA